jgi:hypothetical protein
VRLEEKLMAKIQYKSSKEKCARVKVTGIQYKENNQTHKKLEYTILEVGIPMVKCDDKHGWKLSTLQIHVKCKYRK